MKWLAFRPLPQIRQKALFALSVIVLAAAVLVSSDYLPFIGTSSTKLVEKVSFNTHIRPILNANCLGCHGGVTKQGGISYIFREEALGRGKSGRRNVVPGNPSGSELIARITSDDPHYRMPLERPRLSEREIALLTQWIDEGAEWEDHWAFVPPVKSKTPSGLKHQSWVRSPIDAFVLERMEEHGFAPAPEATRLEWLRRVSLDLTGLPPSTTQIESFLADKSKDAFERVVDQLLDEPAYGERWASVWLDQARYADSKGYANDQHRDAWPYRDWVVEALNTNLGYDDFVIKQLAGDLLPNPAPNDLIATAFHRMTPTNDEGGTDDEEFRLAAVFDRSATTWQALNGITMNCVQCHSHPYDPIHHEEFYQSLAFFNTSEDVDWIDDYPNLPITKNPVERVAAAQTFTLLQSEKDELLNQTRGWSSNWPWSRLVIDRAQQDRLAAAKKVATWLAQEWNSVAPAARALAERCLDLRISRSNGSTSQGYAKISSLKAKCDKIGKQVSALKKLRSAQETVSKFVRTAPRSTKLGIKNGIMRTSDTELQAVSIITVEGPVPVKKALELRALKLTTIPENLRTARHQPLRGFIIDRLKIEVVRKSGERIPVELLATAPTNRWGLNQKLSRVAEMDGLRSDQPGFAEHSLTSPVSLIVIPALPVMVVPGDRILVTLDQMQPVKGDLKPFYLQSLAVEINTTINSAKAAVAYGAALTRLRELNERLDEYDTVALPIMQEQRRESRRATVVFNRGNMFDRTDKFVKADVPDAFPALTAANRNGKATRLDFARWFFSDGHPLTARTAVNRYWEQLFGRGLVVTLEDFGSSGLPPTHPKLLDYLALRFQQDLDWDAKAMIKEIVLSATYRQSSVIGPGARERDPDNSWLARGPRQRLTAEMVRDQALAASNLLSKKIGGPPVMPYQPKGVWDVVGDTDGWQTSMGKDRHRRAIYTYIRRGAPYPSFDAFDDAGHTVSAPRRIVTNTPLQALVTLNDPVYSEATQALGQEMAIVSRNHGFSHGIRYGLLRVATREPDEADLKTFSTAWRSAKANGESDANAWTAMGSVILNLDYSMVR